MKFVSDIWHSNSKLFQPNSHIHHSKLIKILYLVDKNGDVCISILHEAGDDKYGYEKACERWLPVHTVETILLSVISMLADPNYESPANVDAAVRWWRNIGLNWLLILSLCLSILERMARESNRVQKEGCQMRASERWKSLISHTLRLIFINVYQYNCL